MSTVLLQIVHVFFPVDETVVLQNLVDRVLRSKQQNWMTAIVFSFSCFSKINIELYYYDYYDNLYL